MPTKTQISTHKLQLAQKTITYQIKRSWRARYLRITIHPQHGLIISVPKIYPHNKIENFIKTKQSWIQSKLKILQHQKQNIFKFKNHAPITLLGIDYQIEIINTTNIRTQILFPIPKENHDPKQTPKLTIQTPLANIKTAEQYFHKWLKRFTKQTIEQRVSFFTQKHQLRINKITIKNQQTLWGSCSAKQNLNFSKRLIQAPLWLIDYVICHELAHLTHMNHSQQFWDKVGEYYSEHKKARRHLKKWTPHIIIN